ncbi:MAG: hypothetical protein IJJ00_06150 [Erysipelotrichaceae bacterium]|nr:hypothetical protein [Erysipelotrichaceae bacterium]
MFYILSLIWVFSISGLFVLICRKKFGYVLTPAFVISAFILYLFSFLNQLRVGFYLTWLMVFSFWISIACLFIRKDKERLSEFRKNYFTVSAPVFGLLLIYSFVLFRFTGYAHCDEFAHWGRMVIASIKVNGFYAQPQDILDFHQDYPPFFTLFESLWCGFDAFRFYEGHTYIALNAFMFSCFLPMFEKIKISTGKDHLKVVIGVICVLLAGLTVSKTPTASDSAYVYTSIYTDWALALFGAYTMFMVIIDDKWDKYTYILLSVNLSSLLLMKQMGICYYLMILFFAFVKITFVDKELDLKRLIWGIVSFAGIPLCFYLSWKYIIDLYDLTGQFVIGNMKFSDVLDIMRWNVEETWRSEAFVNFCHAVIRRPIVLHPFNMNYPVAAILLSVLMLVAMRFNKISFVSAGIYLIGAVGYMTVMMLLYMLAFDISEAPYLASFDRYMISYLYYGITLVLLSAYGFNGQREGLKEPLIILAVLCLFVETKTLGSLLPRFSVDDSNTMKVLVVRQFGDYEFKRENLNGTKMSFDVYWFDDEAIHSLDGSSTYASAQWLQLLKNYDFILVEGYDDVFYNGYWLPLEQDESVQCYNGQLYYIGTQGDKVSLHMQYHDFMTSVLRFYILDY